MTKLAWNVQFQTTPEKTVFVTGLLPLAASIEMTEHINGYGRDTCITIQNDAAMVSTELPAFIAACLHDAMRKRRISVAWR
jgi:hypothetical protein